MPKRTKTDRDVNWAEFDPYLYLAENYNQILPPDKEILTKIVGFYIQNSALGKFLEVGCGPNLYPVLAALPFADVVDIVEFGAKNIDYLYRQKSSLSKIWAQWIDLLKSLNPQYNCVDFQQQLLVKVNIKKGSIFDLPSDVYDTASMHFVSESITSQWTEFDRANQKFIGALKANSIFVCSFMENSSGYSSPGKPFPAIAVVAADIEKSLGPLTKKIEISKIQTGKGIVRSGHTGMLIATGNT